MSLHTHTRTLLLYQPNSPSSSLSQTSLYIFFQPSLTHTAAAAAPSAGQAASATGDRQNTSFRNVPSSKPHFFFFHFFWRQQQVVRLKTGLPFFIPRAVIA